jgi:hypothetical protein
MERRAREPKGSRIARLRNTPFRGAVACVVAALAAVLAACAPSDAPSLEQATSSLPHPLVANPEGKLTHNGAQALGGSVAITSTHAFVGEIGSGGSRGSVAVFQRSGSTWSLSQTLVASDGQEGDLFGCSIAAESDVAIVGTCKLWYAYQSPGAAYVFERSGSTWSQTQKIVPTDTHEADGFGMKVALSQGTAAITAFDFMADGMWLYVFRRGAGIFSQLAKIGPGMSTWDGFGWDLDIDGNTIAVGAPWHGNTGAVFVYENSGGTTWNETKLVPADAANGDLVGASVAVEGTTLLAGTPREEAVVSPGRGKVHVFTHGVAGWTKTATLQPSDSAPQDCFGKSVTLVDGAALVGASFDCKGATPTAGAAYWFLERSAGWEQGPKIQASDATPEDNFGIAVEAEANRAIVGAGFSIFWENGGDGARAAYVFDARREEGDPCSLGTQCTTGTCEGALCSVVPDGGAGGTGGTGTGGSAGSGTGGSAGSATGGSGGSGGDAGTAGQGATSGAAGSAETGGSAGAAGVGGSNQGGSGGSSTSPDAGTPAATDTPEVSGFYACTTRSRPPDGGPGAAALVAGLFAFCKTRRRRA